MENTGKGDLTLVVRFSLFYAINKATADSFNMQ